jgi:hypothetical protein
MSRSSEDGDLHERLHWRSCSRQSETEANKQAQLAWHERSTRLIVEGMSAIEVIEQIRALPEEERVKVVRFVIEHEESWIPTEFREAMDDAARGKMVDMERVMAGEKPPGI